MARYKGTPQHKLRLLTTIVFGGLLEDLNRLEGIGYETEECDFLKKSLKSIEARCREYAASAWMQEISMRYGDFYFAYDKWNGKGRDSSLEARSHRRTHLAELSKLRDKWAKHVQKNNNRSVGIDPDVALFSDHAIAELKKVSSGYPHFFRNLSGSIERYIENTK